MEAQSQRIRRSWLGEGWENSEEGGKQEGAL